MIVKHGAGKIKTITTTAGSQQVEVGDDARIVEEDGTNVTVKLGDTNVEIELDDDKEVKKVRKLNGRKLAAYVIKRSNEK